MTVEHLPRVIWTFGDVDVHTHAVCRGEVGRRCDRVGFTGERGVQADLAETSGGEESIVFSQSSGCPCGAVTVRYSI